MSDESELERDAERRKRIVERANAIIFNAKWDSREWAPAVPLPGWDLPDPVDNLAQPNLGDLTAGMGERPR